MAPYSIDVVFHEIGHYYFNYSHFALAQTWLVEGGG